VRQGDADEDRPFQPDRHGFAGLVQTHVVSVASCNLL
jgi:hypothetical protein